MSEITNLQFVFNRQITGVNSISLNHNLSHGVGTLPIGINFEEIIQKLAVKFNNLHMHSLPCDTFVPHNKSDDGNKLITAESLDMIRDGKYSNLFDNYVIIDCRYDYEYNGGHIKGALNVQSANLLELLMKSNLSAINNSIAWIFHCEYSQKRGPRAASWFRNIDAKLNQMSYPKLCFPHCYVLEGGYKGYYKNNVSNALTYVSMFDEKYKQQCIAGAELEQKLWTKNNKQKKRRSFKTQVTCVLFVQKLKKKRQARLNASGIFSSAPKINFN
eukprot:65979_1